MRVSLGKFPEDMSERKISIKIHEYDSWNCDVTLAMISVPLLKQLAKQKQGVPSFCIPESYDYDGNDEIALKIGQDKWDTILSHMIWSIEQILDEEFDIFNVNDKMNWNAYWAYMEQVDAGLELFGKHFRSLWS